MLSANCTIFTNYANCFSCLSCLQKNNVVSRCFSCFQIICFSCLSCLQKKIVVSRCFSCFQKICFSCLSCLQKNIVVSRCYRCFQKICFSCLSCLQKNIFLSSNTPTTPQFLFYCPPSPTDEEQGKKSIPTIICRSVVCVPQKFLVFPPKNLSVGLGRRVIVEKKIVVESEKLVSLYFRTSRACVNNYLEYNNITILNRWH